MSKSKIVLSNLSSEELNIMYSEFITTCEKFNISKLKKEDKDYLINRGLTEDMIEYIGFLSMPPKAIMSMYYNALEKKRLQSKLSQLPGFYFDTKYNQWSFFNLNSILIPIKNEFNEIVALQMRDNNPNATIRYKWFSSNFANGDFPNEKGLCNGSSCGSPLSILYSKNRLYDDLFVVEGIFKGIRLINEGYDTASVQGIYSINSGVNETISNIENVRNTKINKIKIAYDADMIYNLNVIKSIIRLIDILKNYDIEICYWEYEKGKGIDDYLEKYDFSTIKYISKNIFLALANYVICESIKDNISYKDKDKISKLFRDALTLLT